MSFTPRTPNRFTGRAGGQSSGRLRRALDGQVDTGRKINESLDVDKDGRLGTKLARDSGLQMTRQGLKLDPIAVGDKNHTPINQLQAVSLDGLTTAQSLVALQVKMNDLLKELKRTGRMR